MAPPALGLSAYGHADQGPDEAVRARVGQAQPPSADIPEERRGEQSHQHRHRGASVGRREHLGRNELHQSIGDGDPSDQYAEEIQKSRQHHRLSRRERFGVDHGRDGVGRIVKAVGGLEQDHHDERENQQTERERRGGIEMIQHASSSERRAEGACSHDGRRM
jgi:hypothetical protein